MTEEIKQAIGAVGELIKAAGDDPKAKEAAHNLGKAAVTVTQAINTCLLPLAALNYGVERARNYFATRFANDVQAATKNIPPEALTEPKASVAGPTLQALAFAHDEAPLRDMYLRLLATAMDGRQPNGAHPSFVEIIKQITATEAVLLTLVLRHQMIQVIRLRRSITGSQDYEDLERFVLPLGGPGGEPKEEPGLVAFIENWVRLGLLEVDWGSRAAGPDAYAWAEARPEVIRRRAEPQPQNRSVTFLRGVLDRTDFGLSFARAVGIHSA